MTSNRSKELEERFDEEFDEFYLPIPDEVRKELKDYIFAITESLLSQQRAELIEKVEGLPNYEMSPVKRKKVALSDVIKLLKGEL